MKIPKRYQLRTVYEGSIGINGIKPLRDSGHFKLWEVNLSTKNPDVLCTAKTANGENIVLLDRDSATKDLAQEEGATQLHVYCGRGDWTLLTSVQNSGYTLLVAAVRKKWRFLWF